MKKLAVLLFFATTTVAQQHPYPEMFPSDFKASACASKEPCQTFTDVSFRGAAEAFLLRDLDTKWDEAHSDEMTTIAQSYCSKRSACNASPGRLWWFCNDVFGQELREACDKRFDPKTQKEDNTQCHTWMDVFSAGVDQRGSADWNAAQKCLKDSAPAQSATHQMDWWMTPSVIPADYKGNIRIFAVDRDTHVPVQADIRFEGQIIYATDPPSGQPITFYPFKWPRKLLRVTRADGHDDLVPVKMSITAPGYETITVETPTVVPTMKVSLKQSKKSFTVDAVDSTTGQPVEAQVYLGNHTVGFTNKPIAMPLPKKHAQLWVRSPFDAYSDVIVK